jgi:hypothetical protein
VTAVGRQSQAERFSGPQILFGSDRRLAWVSRESSHGRNDFCGARIPQGGETISPFSKVSAATSKK